MPDDNMTTTPTTADDTTTTDGSILPPVSSDPVDPTTIPTPPMPADEPATTPPADFPTPSVPNPIDDVPASPTVVDPLLPDEPLSDKPVDEAPSIYQEVASKIAEAHNVLIALSSDPSVDEMCAAIGLSLYLDKLGKRATAIYSGSTPNALEFLNPEETFESTADALQDFVIALNKEKADHLRYKLDGDYVKIYITPYRAKINPDDLDFSYGDFNVDLVLALDVANGIDLDSALREHGRIMHDAVIVNITTGNPGKFGEIEWSDKKSSSVSEMIARLLYSVKSDVEIGKEEATAFLTGIVAATNRFSNAQTTPETMQLSSRLMQSGANQQLISKNITPDIDNEMYSLLSGPSTRFSASSEHKKKDPTNLDIQHEGEEPVDESKEVQGTITEKESTLLDDLKAAEASLAQTGAETTPDSSDQPVRLDGTDDSLVESAPEIKPAANESDSTKPESSEPELPNLDLITEPTTEPEPEMPAVVEPTTTEEPSTTGTGSLEEPSATVEEPALPNLDLPSSDSDEEPSEKVIAPPTNTEDFTTQPLDDGNKYGHMLEEALNDLTNPGSATALNDNPATASAPSVASAPEINGVPEMNFMPPAGENILPPPPTPPIDMSAPSLDASLPSVPIEPAGPTVEPTPEPLGPQPSMQDQVYRPQAADPGAFKIPGM